MKIVVLGANGMLGTYLHKYFKDSIGVTRETVNALFIRNDLFIYQFSLLDLDVGDVVINAIGITNKRTDSVEDFLIVNSLFPRLLADYCEINGIRMIHISTDCVFSGKEGGYHEKHLHDDDNIYGISKSVGEPLNCTTIRTSIIGENRNSNKDLLEWVRKTKNGTLRGWKDHIWNGITCLQFAKICEEIIIENKFWNGSKHIYSPQSITKADLLELINEIYGLNNIIDKIEIGAYCNRTLTSMREDIEFIIPPLRQQLMEQKEFLI